MVIGSQIVCFLVLLLIGYLLIKFFPIKFQIKEMALVSLFLVLGLILSYFSARISLFGFPSLKIGISQIPLMLIGVLFGPMYGFIGGILYDVLGLLVTPTNFPFLGFTLTNVLVCVLPGVWTHYNKKITFKQIQISFLVISVILALLGIIYTWNFTYSTEFQNEVMQMTNVIRIYVTIGIVAVIALMDVVVYYVLNKLPQDIKDNFTSWLVCVLIVELFVNLCINPLWLQIMYEIPYVLNFFVRLLKIMITVPLYTFIGYYLLKAISRVYKSKKEVVNNEPVSVEPAQPAEAEPVSQQDPEQQ